MKFFAKIWYTFAIIVTKPVTWYTLKTKNKNNSHARSPAIGQPHIVEERESGVCGEVLKLSCLTRGDGHESHRVDYGCSWWNWEDGGWEGLIVDMLTYVLIVRNKILGLKLARYS